MELGKKKPTLPKELFYMLRTYGFPGNVRELKGMILDAVSRHQRGVLSISTFRNKIYSKNDTEQKDHHDFNNNEKEENQVLFSGTLPTFREIEKILINEALNRSNGNKTLASKMLGIRRQALQNRIKKLSKNNYPLT
jgi:transcriptional regulator with PAS, ATPase and Fis domain